MGDFIRLIKSIGLFSARGKKWSVEGHDVLVGLGSPFRTPSSQVGEEGIEHCALCFGWQCVAENRDGATGLYAIMK